MDEIPVTEFPKMLYNHPVDKTKEHKFIVVNSQSEQDAAIDKGYKLEPHLPEPTVAESFEGTAFEAPVPNPAYSGSGTERWADAGAWTDSVGQGLTDDISAFKQGNYEGTVDSLPRPVIAGEQLAEAEGNYEQAKADETSAEHKNENN